MENEMENEHMISLYDFIAKIAWELIQFPDLGKKLNEYYCITDDKKKELNNMPVIRELNNASYSALSITYDYTDYYNEAKKGIISEEYFGVFRLLELADSIVEEVKNFSPLNFNRVLNPLNKELLKNVLILPKIRKHIYWSNHTPAEFSGNINQLFANLIVVNVSNLSGFKVINHLVQNDEEERFLIAGSPITTDVKMVITLKSQNGLCYFCPKISHTKEEIFVKLVLEIAKDADKQNCTLLVFPELISTKALNEHLVNALKSMKFKVLKFIALPTYYDSQHNIGAVFSTQLNDIIFDQIKEFPFIYNSHLEDIITDKTLHLLHIPHLGVIAFPICKDALSKDYIRICEELQVDVVAVRSLTTEGGIVFFKRIGSWYTSIACCLFLVNSHISIEGSMAAETVCLVSHCKEPTIEQCKFDSKINNLYIFDLW